MTTETTSFRSDNDRHRLVRQRLQTLEKLFDPVSQRHLGRTGLTAGWRCLEVGAGAGSIARYLSMRVGPAGTVLATDVDTTLMGWDVPPNLVILQHDISVDPLPEQRFDLIHARAVLTFVPDRLAAIDRMVAALKPGGWLVIEEFVSEIGELFYPTGDPDADLVRAFRNAGRAALSNASNAPALGRSLPRMIASTALQSVDAEGYFLPMRNPAIAELATATLDLQRAAMIETGLITDAELDRCRQLLNTSLSYPGSFALVTAWGQRSLGGAPA